MAVEPFLGTRAQKLFIASGELSFPARAHGSSLTVNFFSYHPLVKSTITEIILAEILSQRPL